MKNKNGRMYNFALVGLALLPLVVMGVSPIALNGGGAPAWSGGSFASVSTGATGCTNYSFSSESTLGFGRAGADEWCIGSSTSNKYVSIKKNGTKTQLVFNGGYDTTKPHISEVDNTDDGFVIGDATNPFAWVEGGTVRGTLGLQSGRTYLCFGAWNTNGIPCFTSSGGADFTLMDSDGSSFGGTWYVGTAPIILRAGTNSAPSVYFDGDSDTGFYRSAANEWGVTLNGTQAGVLGSATSSLKPASGYYINILDISGAPAVTCTGSAGWLQYDYTNHRLYACNDLSGTRAGWDYADLTD